MSKSTWKLVLKHASWYGPLPSRRDPGSHSHTPPFSIFSKKSIYPWLCNISGLITLSFTNKPVWCVVRCSMDLLQYVRAHPSCHTELISITQETANIVYTNIIENKQEIHPWHYVCQERYEDRARDCCLRQVIIIALPSSIVAFLSLNSLSSDWKTQGTTLVLTPRHYPLNIYSGSHLISNMTSTGHKNPFSEGAPVETVLLPARRDDTADNGPSSTEPTGTAPYPSSRGSEDKPWKPSFNRQQSWNEQDMKHCFQERLLGSERGRESGFTEAERRG